MCRSTAPEVSAARARAARPRAPVACLVLCAGAVDVRGAWACGFGARALARSSRAFCRRAFCPRVAPRRSQAPTPMRAARVCCCVVVQGPWHLNTAFMTSRLSGSPSGARALPTRALAGEWSWREQAGGTPVSTAMELCTPATEAAWVTECQGGSATAAQSTAGAALREGRGEEEVGAWAKCGVERTWGSANPQGWSKAMLVGVAGGGGAAAAWAGRAVEAAMLFGLPKRNRSVRPCAVRRRARDVARARMSHPSPCPVCARTHARTHARTRARLVV